MSLLLSRAAVLLRIKKMHLDPALQLLSWLRHHNCAPFTFKAPCASEDKKCIFCLLVHKSFFFLWAYGDPLGL